MLNSKKFPKDGDLIKILQKTGMLISGIYVVYNKKKVGFNEFKYNVYPSPWIDLGYTHAVDCKFDIFLREEDSFWEIVYEK